MTPLKTSYYPPGAKTTAYDPMTIPTATRIDQTPPKPSTVISRTYHRMWHARPRRTDPSSPGLWIPTVRPTPQPSRRCPCHPSRIYRDRLGRFGVHNLRENQPIPTPFVSEQLIFGSYCSDGMRVHDITNPFQPKEVARFILEFEEDPGIKPLYRNHATDSININDVYVDENCVVYAIDRVGIYDLGPATEA